jgi:hypothetical protein
MKGDRDMNNVYRTIIAILIIAVGTLGFLYYQEQQNEVGITIDAPQ